MKSTLGAAGSLKPTDVFVYRWMFVELGEGPGLITDLELFGVGALCAVLLSALFVGVVAVVGEADLGVLVGGAGFNSGECSCPALRLVVGVAPGGLVGAPVRSISSVVVPVEGPVSSREL